MAKISIDMVKPGMVLSEDLRSDMGRFLLGAGTELSDKHCRVLRIWGVGCVDVQDDGKTENPLAGLDSRLILKAQDEVSAAFRNNDPEHPLIKELSRLTVLRRARLAASGDIKRAAPAPDVADQGLERLDIGMDELLRNHDIELGAMPVILGELVEIINDPRCSAVELARVVEKDTALTARLLRIVNSPFYGFPSKIDTISRAVTIIGSRQLTTLAVGVVAIQTFQDIPGELVDMSAFWKHSLLTGFCSRIIAGHTNTPNSERFFVAGLLHDVGRLVLFRLLPAESARILSAAKAAGVSCERTERKALGFDHGLLGGNLLKNWNFPMALENSVKYHHAPMGSPCFIETAVVHVSDVIVWAMQDDSPASPIPALNATAWEGLGLHPMLLGTIMEQLDLLYRQTARHFLSDQ